MRASCLFYSFAATGLALLVLANYTLTLFDASLHSRRQPPTRPRMKRETVVAETAVPSAASHREASCRPTPDAVRQRQLRLLPGGTSTPLALKWRALSALLASGAELLCTDADAVLGAPPFELASLDSDFELLSDGWDEESAHGFIMGQA
ncbi:hypothetical protein EMIHUDRAFT_238320 [Emiliania huxleyi CCMP1516]|uniref:Nucleotide-diphospho-sugar transferase domain-containing protein n=2 Tax=Emiliania huxleyi TaxID=2903 RepID=A0A0D3JMS5_EMIH1|nr:hypothetical protein EMIHUDRAFT_238320 [Emiliania huxleyi CCMP1516]EOD24810.1 hypothetical protein EMIHUDRAFT_238320 [Emiliania huxleyi CCMP1516]|eukprot:XP_005777239.1 hypothetical protein EMIHUDRAFT_238320 [Emiliania huxleyi CCMP1516]